MYNICAPAWQGARSTFFYFAAWNNISRQLLIPASSLEDDRVSQAMSWIEQLSAQVLAIAGLSAVAACRAGMINEWL